jgi:hypothetical protein
LSHALKGLYKIRRESAQNVFPQTGEGQAALLPAQSRPNDEQWQYIKAFQLNLTALLLAATLTLVIVLAFL